MVDKMGVLECDRHGCENIMCDYYSDEFGYLCWECKQELEEYCRIYGVTRQSIRIFMNSEKCSNYDDSVIDEIFRRRD
jgi:hypothetical protein